MFSPLSIAIMSCGGGSESSDDLNSTEALSEISLCMIREIVKMEIALLVVCVFIMHFH